ncbi:hypothetical protein BDR03DRAFT_986069 [Suillus americanus]|nr:hypothetical protein BDR03DRAFT_986069 [Suillus americanus]
MPSLHHSIGFAFRESTPAWMSRLGRLDVHCIAVLSVSTQGLKATTASCDFIIGTVKSSRVESMVETRMDNWNKRPGLPDLPPKHRKVVDTDFPASEDNAPTGKMKAGGVKKPAGHKATKEQKAHAAGKVAELEMYMEIEDVQNEKLAVRRPRPALNKVPKKPSTQIWSANATNLGQALTWTYLDQAQSSGSRSASQAHPGNSQIIQ